MPAGASATSSARRRPPVAALIAISALSPFAINVVVPSLPAIERAFATSYARVQLILSLYLAAVACSQILIGPFSDRFGRRPVLLVGFLVFIAASLAAPFATSVEGVVAARIVQGASGCVGIVLGRAIVRDMFDRQQAASMIGYITMGFALAPMLAPTIGGVLQELFDWPAIFWCMALLGVLCLAVTWTSIPETNYNRTAELSLRSMFSNFGRLLRLPDFLLFTANASLISAIFFTFLGGAAFVSERFLGLTPAVYGLWFGLLPLGYATGSFIAGRFTERFGVARMILAGSALAVAGSCISPLLFWAGFATPAALFVPMVASTIANGVTLPSAISGAISLRPEIAGAAAGLSGATQIGAGALVSTIGGAALAAGQSAQPMFLLMLAAAVLSLVTALAIYRRAEARRHGSA